MLRTVLVTLLISCSLLAGASPVVAGEGFFGTATFFTGAWDSTAWEYFGGCTIDTCAAPYHYSNMFVMGELNVKQGVYSVKGPTVDPARGRFVFQYTYYFQSEENSDSTADKGMIKVKNVATDEIYYYKEVYPDETGSAHIERFTLPNDYTQETLQWVFEITNDGERLSTMEVYDIAAVHQDKPIITGKTYRWDNGSKLGIAGAKLLLKRKGHSKIIASTTSDQDGNFEFFPVRLRTRYTVIAKYQGARRTVQHKHVSYGSISDKQIEFP